MNNAANLLTVSIIAVLAALPSTVLAATSPTNILQVSSAYKAVAVPLMLKEVNHFARQLNLPLPQPIQITHIKKMYVTPPRMGFGGVIETTNFFFSFYNEGKLWSLTRMEDGHSYLDASKFDDWTKIPSLINSNGAYQLATQWLTSVSVDVSGLEKKNPVNFYQWFVWSPEVYPLNNWKTNPPDSMKVMLPVFDVKWGGGDTPAIKVTVLGTTKELAEITLNDTSFSQRPPIVITNYEELLNIPDPPKKQLTPLSKTNGLIQSVKTNRPSPFHRQVEDH